MRLASAALLACALGLAACGPDNRAAQAPDTSNFVPQAYQARVDRGPNGEPLDIPAIKPAYLRERNVRTVVPYNGPEAPGTVVVDPYARFLYLVEDGGMATRVGIAVGRAGVGYAGTATIRRKAQWPSWTPTANMVATEPELYAQFRGGVPGGVGNPLGSRALYLYEGSRDTMYRIHGTMDPSSVGKATSAGCIRLFNQDIMDLYDRIPMGTTVKVRTEAESRALEGPLRQTPDGYLEPAQSVAAVVQPVTVAPQPVVVASQPVAVAAQPVAPPAAPLVESAVPRRRF
ncbi:L,D-transpeptidase [Paracoccus sp. (in: a-proteobacteria)]|uniref:L,D-transpeptidase n=1 Tax=Paracoccus sp. TaxID=267 RepID=UPI0026DF725E|nr:L,D-transpeptidase [Paracoccus sp. (in: a-proteobacteria)]MDO5370016.1 L,D-transpeptidase [Paracoccus sp. (in: a-proteobacteria)]